MKYYAVKEGRKPGIYLSWDECKKQVNGYSGAVYKSFASKEDAREFMGIDSGKKVNINFTEEQLQKMVASNDRITAFVDGSYDDSQKMYSFGLVAIGLGEIHTDSCADFEPMALNMRNVAGELLGATEAMEYALEKGVKYLDIYYDYEGIEKWATGAWKCNKIKTQEYKNYFDSIKNKLEITFHKVPAHTGILYNETADALAKSALGIR